ncbi:MAG: flagellar hook-basal body complex protein [Thermodesulfobacteriota bacterium]
MSILGTFFNGLSGVGRMGDNMGVLADNISNLNTTGFKGNRANFEAVLNAAVAPGLEGAGVRLADVGTDFRLGGFDPSKVSTDAAIDGHGFFILDNGNGDRVYTRAGQFRLVENGAIQDVLHLVSPTGLAVQGYGLAADGSIDTTSVAGVTVDRFSQASATTAVQVSLNLDATTDPESPSVSLFESWDGRNVDLDGRPAPLAGNAFDFTTSLRIYDDQGDAFDLSLYFDSTDSPDRKEFLLACDPSLDRRLIEGTTARYNDPGRPADKGAGALLYGILQFNTHGELIDLAAYTVPADGNVDPDGNANRVTLGRGEAFHAFSYNFSGVGENLSSTIDFGTQAAPQKLSSAGRALLSPPGDPASYVASTSTWSEVYDTAGNRPAAGDTITFTGSAGDGTPVQYAYTINPASQIADLLANLELQFNCTARVENGVLTLTDNEIGDSLLALSSISYRDGAGRDPAANPALAQLFGDEGSGFTIDQQQRFQLGGMATSNYAAPSSVLTQGQDGYGRGFLEGVRFTTDGRILGEYSNGKAVAQGQVLLANFTNLGGLTRLGGNLFGAFDGKVGAIRTSTPASAGFGSLQGFALEGSNVDLGKQFVELITTQRAYQANAKSIQTADEVYQRLVALLR